MMLDVDHEGEQDSEFKVPKKREREISQEPLTPKPDDGDEDVVRNFLYSHLIYSSTFPLTPFLISDTIITVFVLSLLSRIPERRRANGTFGAPRKRIASILSPPPSQTRTMTSSLSVIVHMMVPATRTRISTPTTAQTSPHRPNSSMALRHTRLR